MTAQLQKQLVLFPHPMGERVLHFVSLPGQPGPWLALEEACLKIFGVDSPIQAKSKETIRKAALKLSGKEGHLLVCDDAEVKRLLVSARVIGPQAFKFTMLSAAAIETLVQNRGGGPGMIHALKQIDHSELLEGPFFDNHQVPSCITGTTTSEGRRNLPMEVQSHSQGYRLLTPEASLSITDGQTTEEDDADFSDNDPDWNEEGEPGTSSDEDGLPQGIGPLAPDRLKLYIQPTPMASTPSAITCSVSDHTNSPATGNKQSRQPDSNPKQFTPAIGLYGRQQANSTLRPLFATNHQPIKGGKPPRYDKLSSPTTRKRQRACNSILTTHRSEHVQPGLPFRIAGNAETDDMDDVEDGLPCYDTEEYYDVDDDDEEAQLRRAFKAEARMLRQRVVPSSVRLGDRQQGRWSSSQLQSDYGLKEVHVSKALQQQLELLVGKLSSTSIEPLRHLVVSQPLASTTIVKFKKDICRFLGYLRNIKGWEDRCITLSAFSNTKVFSEFLEFLDARTRGVPSNKVNDMHTVTLVAIRVNRFLANLLARQSDYCLLATDNSATRAIEYLERIKAELSMLRRREAGSSVREKPALPAASETLQFVERLIDEALSAVEQEADSAGTETEGGGHSSETNLLSMKVCEQVRDAAMMAMMAGHVCLTVRISIIRTIKASCFSSTPCTHHGCTLSGCTDNRLEVVEQTSNSLEMPKYRIVVPHHKTASRGIMMPPVSIYSRKLTKLLNIWEQRARPQLVKRSVLKYMGWQDPQTLFLTNRGSPFQRLGDWYAKLHERYAPPFKPVPLNKYRSIFVTDRLENPEMPGPSNEGAAIIMGNSVPTWKAAYHNNRRAWLADRAAADAEKYRIAQIYKYKQQVSRMQDEDEDEFMSAVSESD